MIKRVETAQKVRTQKQACEQLERIVILRAPYQEYHSSQVIETLDIRKVWSIDLKHIKLYLSY